MRARKVNVSAAILIVLIGYACTVDTGGGDPDESGGRASGGAGGSSGSGGSAGSNVGGSPAGSAGESMSGGEGGASASGGEGGEAPEPSAGSGGESGSSLGGAAGHAPGGTGGVGGDSGSSGEGGAPATTLTGAEVTFSVHCCTAPPSAVNLVSAVLTATIGPEVEFSAIGSTGTSAQSVIDANVDVSDTFLTIQYTRANTAAQGTFNGYVLEFVPTERRPVLPIVTDARLSPETTFASGVSVDFIENAIWINVSGLAIPADSVIAVEFSLE